MRWPDHQRASSRPNLCINNGADPSPAFLMETHSTEQRRRPSVFLHSRRSPFPALSFDSTSSSPGLAGFLFLFFVSVSVSSSFFFRFPFLRDDQEWPLLKSPSSNESIRFHFGANDFSFRLMLLPSLRCFFSNVYLFRRNDKKRSPKTSTWFDVDLVFLFARCLIFVQ